MEYIETLNNRLRDFYGLFENGEPNFRLVWSEDQVETRYGEFEKVSPSGLYLGMEKGFRLMPKYRHYMDPQWVLERNVGVPLEAGISTKTSYEPLWAFGNKQPAWEPIKVLIDTVINNLHKHISGAKYKEDEKELNTPEALEYRAKKLQELLFEDDTISDAIHYGDGIVMPADVHQGEVVK